MNIDREIIIDTLKSPLPDEDKYKMVNAIVQSMESEVFVKFIDEWWKEIERKNEKISK